MSGELEVLCRDGTYSLVHIYPHPNNEHLQNLKMDESGVSNVSDTFALKIEIKKNNMTITQLVRATMELSTDMKKEGAHSIRARIRFPEIDKIPSAAVYFTVVSLTRITENWKHFISVPTRTDPVGLKQNYTLLLQTTSKDVSVEKRSAALYMVKKINRTIDNK